MKALFSNEEQYLMAMLKEALSELELTQERYSAEKVNTAAVIKMAGKHSVLPFLYEKLSKNPRFEENRGKIQRDCMQTVLQSYRLLFLTRYVVDVLKEHDIASVVLKGAATASLYPVLELRKSGDVDLLISADVEEKKLIQVMSDAGFFVSEKQHANHHIVFVSQDGIDVEVHNMLAEPFEYKKINQAMEARKWDCMSHVYMADVLGIRLPILDKPFHAYELLLHMLQHFMYAGFGLKLLCDWVVIWNTDWQDEEKGLFKELAAESGLLKFAEAVTAVCIKFLGLREENFAWKINDVSAADEFMRDILDAEDFGNADTNRMVMMRGTSLWDYVTEFHHQMHLNFPRAGKCFLLWPLLWCISLIQFIHNNRVVRNTSTIEVLKKAKKRSRIMKKLRLFC